MADVRHSLLFSEVLFVLHTLYERVKIEDALAAAILGLLVHQTVALTKEAT